MRVLIVNDHPPRSGSGAEVHVRRLADGLVEAGDDVELFAGEVTHAGAGRLLDLWDPFARRALAARVRAFRPDVVHYHNVIRELSASVFGSAPGRGRVLTVHDSRIAGIPDGPVDRPFDAPPLRAVKMTKARFDRSIARRHVHEVMAPSEAIAGLLRRAGFANVHVVPHFAPAGDEPALPPSACADVLFASRLTGEKGAAQLIEAFAAVAARHHSSRLVVANEGPERPRLEAEAARLPEGRVWFAGMLPEDEVRRRMGSARVVTAPSLTMETFGMITMEAGFAGRPVVVSDDPALRSLVDAWGCGIVTPRGDVGALAAALDRLLSDGALCDRLGRAGRAGAMATCSTKAGIARTREVYAAAIARAGGERPIAAGSTSARS